MAEIKKPFTKKESKNAASEEKLSRPVSEAEMRIAFEGSAIATNRTFITLGPGGVRIAFAEQQGASPPVFRSAVMLAYQDAISFKDVLTNLLKDVEEKIAAAAKENG